MLNQEDIMSLVKEILIKNEVKIPANISKTDNIRELGINSLAFIDLIFELEERLNITITLDDSDKIQTVEDLIAKIDNYLIDQTKN